MFKQTSGADSSPSESQHHPAPLSPVSPMPAPMLEDDASLLLQQGDTAADAALRSCARTLDAAIAAVESAGLSSDAVAMTAASASSSVSSTRKRPLSAFMRFEGTSNVSNDSDNEHITKKQSLSAVNVSTATIATAATTATESASTSIAFHDVPTTHAVHAVTDAENPLADHADAAAACAIVIASGAAAATATTTTTTIGRASRRTLYIEYWSRTDECKERKWDHLDAIADQYGCAEDHIFATTLHKRTACLEPNMFPYATPAGIEHWTLWHERDLTHSQIKQYVENWIDANAPHVESWNYDDNPERSIDIFHVHVYLQVPSGATVLQGRTVDDLVHELD